MIMIFFGVLRTQYIGDPMGSMLKPPKIYLYSMANKIW